LFKTMIVDDIVPTLQYIKQLVPWEELGLQVVSTSNSAVMALEQFKELLPDILITDIGMPQMDGIKLAEQCKQIKRETRVIFLTCHEDFHFAKRAFQMDADNYLIKDELTKDKLKQSLLKSVVQLKTLHAYMNHSDYRGDLLRNLDMLKQSFIKQLLRSDPFGPEMTERGRRIGIEWTYDRFMLIHGSIDLATYERKYALNDFHLIGYGVYNILQEIGMSFEVEYSLFKMTPFLFHSNLLEKEVHHLVIIANYHKKAAFTAADTVNGYLRKVQAIVDDYLKVKVGFTASAEFADLSLLRKTHEELREFNFGLYYKETSLHFMDKKPQPRWNQDEEGFLYKATDQIHIHLLKKEYACIKPLIVEAAGKAKAVRIHPGMWIAKCVQWMHAIEAETKQPFGEELYLYLQRSQKWTETLQLMESQLHHLQHVKSSEQVSQAKEVKLHAVDRYISDNLTANITTLSMAQHLYLNPSYFSRYFKKMTGDNFTDYVHRVKMEVATKLLQNDYESVESIAIKLGYNDRTYFSKVFKKYIGISPSDYRS
jgi:two-component system response regulator YesN